MGPDHFQDVFRRVRAPKLYADWKDFFRGGPGPAIGRTGLWTLSALAKGTARNRGFGVPDYFAGKVEGSEVDEAFLLRLVDAFPPGVTEVMLHPGLDNEKLVENSGWQHDFETEYKAMCSPALQERMAVNGIEAGNYLSVGNYK